MRRRRFLGAGLSLAGAAMVHVRPAKAAAISRVRPGMPGWPTDADWASLKQAVGGRLSPVTQPNFDPAVRKLLSDPFYIGDQPGLTQSSGWLDAWRSLPSAYVITAESASDVAAAIRFARAHDLRLVVKGGGHSYLGTSNAPDSLLVWTRPMNAIIVHDAFTPQGSSAAPVPAVSAGAGGIWLHAYQAVTGGAGRYVQGGGCTTLGVPGLVQGGGFGSFSKAYGTVAASLLEAEIVTADAETRIVNEAREPDLFWALKGGGGGTFGVVTRVTLATHELPETFGAVHLALRARSDDAYRRLLARFVEFYATSLCNPHWGEQAIARPDNRLQIRMVFQGLTQDEAHAAWQPLIDFASANSADYEGQHTLVTPRCRPGISGTPISSAATLPPPLFSTAGQTLRRPISGGPATPTRSAPFGTPTLRLGCPPRCSSRKTRRSSWTPGLPPAGIGGSFWPLTRASPAPPPQRSRPRETPR
jgi:hypothetical protein